MKNFEKAKEIDPRKVDPYYGIALIKYYEEDYDSALSEIAEYNANTSKKISRRDLKTLNSLNEKLELVD